MTLGDLIEMLEKEPRDKILRNGFHNAHSYRGYYDELAFEPVKYVSVNSIISLAKTCIGQTFEGYKGGNYTMSEYTPIWLAEYGSTGESIGPTLMSYILADEVKPGEEMA